MQIRNGKKILSLGHCKTYISFPAISGYASVDIFRASPNILSRQHFLMSLVNEVMTQDEMHHEVVVCLCLCLTHF